MRRYSVCLLASGLLVICACLLYFLIRQLEQQEAEKRARSEMQRIAETLAAVKAGDTRAYLNSPDLVVVLANDEECIRNLQSVDLTMTELDDPKYAQMTQLSNVQEIVIYDCGGVDTFLKSIAGMPSVKKIYFESVDVDDSLIESLSSFPNLIEVQFEQYLDQSHQDLLSETLPSVKVLYADRASDRTVQLPSLNPQQSPP